MIASTHGSFRLRLNWNDSELLPEVPVTSKVIVCSANVGKSIDVNEYSPVLVSKVAAVVPPSS